MDFYTPQTILVNSREDEGGGKGRDGVKGKLHVLAFVCVYECVFVCVCVYVRAPRVSRLRREVEGGGRTYVHGCMWMYVWSVIV